MSTAPASAQAQDGASDINRFRHPIEFLFKEHDRQRVILATLELLAHDCTADHAPEDAALVLAYLEHEMPLHIADEEEDLLPLLTRRCTPEDEIDELVALLSSEHETDEKHYLALLAPLRAIVNGRRPPDPDAICGRRPRLRGPAAPSSGMGKRYRPATRPPAPDGCRQGRIGTEDGGAAGHFRSPLIG